jgi:uncharacterized protein (UPF0276 family)
MLRSGTLPLLTTNISDALLDLLAMDGSFVDALEVGPWLTPEQITAYRQKLPDFPFIFHGANLIVEVGENLGVEKRIQAYLDCTGSPWVSVHLSVWEPGDFGRLMHGERLMLPDPELALDRLLRRLETLVKLVPVPVLVENLEPLPFDGYDFWSRPEYICRVLERSGCGFLLDTGHLRVSADRLGMAVETYLGQLPLEKIVEIHVSGPRRRSGRLLDMHMPLQSADYMLLELLLSRSNPHVVTLEYIREREQLSKQLTRLRRLPKMHLP